MWQIWQIACETNSMPIHVAFSTCNPANSVYASNNLLPFQRQKICKYDGCASQYFLCQISIVFGLGTNLIFLSLPQYLMEEMGFPWAVLMCFISTLNGPNSVYILFNASNPHANFYRNCTNWKKKIPVNVCKLLFPAECFVYLLETCRWYQTQKMGEVSLYIRGTVWRAF